MQNLRSKIPQRTCTREYTDYTSYKSYLKSDFDSRCGYCDDHDQYYGGSDSYHIDHFAPKKFADLISKYSNLVYSCPFCNKAKRNKWPSDDQNVNVVGDEGFIDPCSENYDIHLNRDENGSIISVTPIGGYMHKHLELNLNRHAIIWKLDRINEAITKIQVLRDSDSELGEDLSNRLNQLLADYREYDQRLKDTYNK
ncbi:MAG: HNH endonuclease signature motif containing protein [Microgenomates group bacterium]|jgi:hypothetical protein